MVVETHQAKSPQMSVVSIKRRPARIVSHQSKGAMTQTRVQCLPSSDIPLEYHVGEDETCPVCGKHKGPHKQLERCKICKKQHLGTCDRACKICGSGRHPTKYHPNRAESSTDNAANFARFVSAGLTSAWNNRYGGITKPGQGRSQSRGRGHGQRGGQNRGSDRGQGRGQRGGRGRGRGNPDPKAKGHNEDNRPAPQ